jgi:hypothetical protein
MEEINYNGNKIVHYSNGDYVGYWFADGDIQSKTFKTLSKAEAFLDDIGIDEDSGEY